MTKTIIFCVILALLIFVAGYIIANGEYAPFKEETEKLEERKDKAHKAAELLRELGYKEDCEEIKGLQDIWWDAHNEIKRYESYDYMGRYYITGYDACYSCCGKTDGITASGTKATVGRTVAMKNVPFGTKIYIDGIGERVVEDRGVSSGRVDVFCGNHSECYAITGYYDVFAVKG